jgi:hypothetical protein
MGNAFDSANYPEKEPSQLTVGDRWLWKRTDLGTDYPPASYSLKYALRRHDTGAEIEITASESGADYLVEVASATTALYAAGFYVWTAYIIRSSDSERLALGTGTVELVANRDAAAETTDPRTHARKVLDAIEAVLENRATVDQEEYSFAGRSLKRMPIEDLIKFRKTYKAEVDAEVLATSGAGGRKLVMRF